MLSTLRTQDSKLLPSFTTEVTAIAIASPSSSPSLVPQHRVPGLNGETFEEWYQRQKASMEPMLLAQQKAINVCAHPVIVDGVCPDCRDAEADASMRQKMEEEQAQMKRDAFDKSCSPPEGDDFDARKRYGERAHQNRLVKKGKNSKRHFDNFKWQEARRVAKGKSPRSNPRDKHDHRTNKAATLRRADWESDHLRSTIGVGAPRIHNAQHLQCATAYKRNGPTPKPSTDQDNFDVNGNRAFDDETFFHHTEVEEILLDFEAYYEAQEAAYAAHIAYQREIRKAFDLEVLHNIELAGGIGDI